MTPLEQAKSVVERCRTKDGFLASADLYKDLWLRDLVYSESTLIRLGYQETVRRHFSVFLKYQLKNGQIPTVVLMGWWKHLFSGMYHSWTSDSEILFVLGIIAYTKMTGDYTFLDKNRTSIERCVNFIRGRVNSLGLLPRLDWRDAVILHDNGTRCFLSNQVLLAQMYDELGRTEDASALKETIRKLYFSQRSETGLFLPVDCIFWGDNRKEGEKADEMKFDYRLDSLGTSLAILSDIISQNVAIEAAKNLDRAKTRYGYRNLSPSIHIQRSQAFASPKMMNAFVRNGAFLRNRKEHYQNSSVWPFVEAKIVSAFRKLGFSQEAEELSKRMVNRKGFSEWYSPIDGRAHGSRDQLWTAAAVLDQ